MSKYDDELSLIYKEDNLSLAGPPLNQTVEGEAKKYDAEVAAIYKQQHEHELTKLQDSLYFGVQKNPESYAEVVKLAKQTGLPIPVVERNKGDVEKKYKLSMIDPETFRTVNPVTAKFLMNPYNAGVLSDEVKKLAEVEGQFADYSKGYWGTALNSILRSYSSAVTGMVQGVPTVLGKENQALLSQFDRFDQTGPTEKDKEYNQYFGHPKFREYMTADPERRKVLREEAARNMDPRNYQAWQIAEQVQKSVTDAYRINPVYGAEFGAGVLSQGVGSMLAFMTASSVFRSTAAVGAMASLGEISSGFKDALQHGASLEDAMTSGLYNIPSGLLEMVPIARMFDRVDKMTGGGIKRALIEVMKSGIEEGGQEFIQQVWNNLIAAKVVKYDPERGLLVGAGPGGAAGFTIGAVTQFLLGLATGRKTRGSSDVQTTLEQSMLNELHDVAKNMESLKRTPDTFREYLAQLQETYGPDESVYIPAKHLQEVVDQGLVPEGTNAGTAILEQYEEARKLGGDVVIPVSDYIVDIAGNEEIADVFRDIVRLSPDSLSIREAREVDPENPQGLLQLVEQAGRNADVKAEVDVVVNELVDQLVSTGVVNKRHAQVNAKIFSAYVATKAANTGKSPKEIFESMNLDIYGTRTSTLPQQIYEPGQDFGDLNIEDEVVVEETGEKVRIKRRAQDVWDDIQQKRDNMSRLLECLRG